MAFSSPLAFGPAAWLHTPDSDEHSTPFNSESDTYHFQRRTARRL